jgi:NAD(P) transhydrogenase subunit alpha
MSGANAISGITLVGTLVTSGMQLTTFTTILGFLAVAMATANVVGGFLVTHRMLGMFRPTNRSSQHQRLPQALSR